MDVPDVNIAIVARGVAVTVRTMTPADREREADFVRRLSAESRYFRFHMALRELTPQMLDVFTKPDFHNSMALIATVSEGDSEREIAVARYARYPGTDAAEVAIVVADEWQGCGIGTRMLTELRDLAETAGIGELHLRVLPENTRMLRLAQELGFYAVAATEPGDVSRVLEKAVTPAQNSPRQ